MPFVVNDETMKPLLANDIMIDLLQEASRHFGGADPAKLRQIAKDEFPILQQLLRAEKIEGGVVQTKEGAKVYFNGITLEGRQLLDELCAKRDAKRWPARLKHAGWLVLAWVGGIFTVYVKAWIEHRFQK
jgi:hypothetical protein